MRIKFGIESLIVIAVFCLLQLPLVAQAGTNEEVEEWIRKGDQALAANDLKGAEELFTKALDADPKNWRVMHSLAQISFNLNKVDAAKVLVDRILAMPVSQGRDVLVFYPDSDQGEEAELVDEIVLPPQRTKNNMRNYLDIKGNKPIPHYRLFFKNTGQMQLVPQSVVRIEYKGVLKTVYNEVQVLAAKVDKALVASGGSKSPTAMVNIEKGCFQMGSNEGTPFEQPAHEVCLNAFQMDKHEVTQAQFQSVMEENPSQIVGADRPVESVTWDEANRYCKKVGKRLPTEAEWEYAARSGTATVFYWGNTLKGTESNFCDKQCELNIRVSVVDDGYATTAPVGKFPPNAWGLQDMAGNVAEWVNDWMDPNYYRKSPKDNPPGPRPFGKKVVRGGAWNTTAGYLRPSNRAALVPGMRFEGVGFRCVINP